MDERRKILIRRRDLLIAVTAAGAVVATGTTASSVTSADVRRDKRKPQYQATSPEVQTFYRVNRYPVK
jgi:hypothetical protein